MKTDGHVKPPAEAGGNWIDFHIRSSIQFLNFFVKDLFIFFPVWL